MTGHKRQTMISRVPLDSDTEHQHDHQITTMV
jgi:hypothetical protein